MIQDIEPHRFRNEYHEEKARADSPVICCRGREIFLKCTEDEIIFPTYAQVTERFPAFAGCETYLFSLDGTPYFLFREDGSEVLSDWADEALTGFRWEKIERMRTAGPGELAFAAATGIQLAGWYASRKFCPRCGRAMVHSERERMMYCPQCGQTEYPKICPAVIVAVTNGDRLLLTKYAGRSYAKYALIAGFAEIGETIEDTVRREVMEEVGLKVKNLRYYKSQPWAFTDTLLMGFFCELDGEDTICLDETELSVAKWCAREEVPEDDGVSLTREMMRVFKEGGPLPAENGAKQR